MYFCDTLYEGVGQTPILAWQRGDGGLVLGQNCMTSFMNAPQEDKGIHRVGDDGGGIVNFIQKKLSKFEG